MATGARHAERAAHNGRDDALAICTNACGAQGGASLKGSRGDGSWDRDSGGATMAR